MYIRCPYYKQTTNFSCGPTAIKMLLDFWENDQEFSEKRLIKDLHTKPKIGTDNKDIVQYFINYAYKIYFSKKGDMKIIEQFIDLGLPILVNYRNLLSGGGHFALIIGYDDKTFILNDPNYGESYRVAKKSFMESWTNSTGDIEHWFLVPIKEPYFRFYELGDLEKGFVGI